MKKFVSVLSVLCILLCLCSCKIKSKGGEETEVGVPEPPLSYEDKEYTEDFKDSSGNVIATLDFRYPEFSSKDEPEIAEKINTYVAGVKDKAADKIRLNLGNTAEYKKNLGITGSTITDVSFEMVYNGEYYLSFRMNTKEGTDISETDGFTEGYTFSTLDGERLSVAALLKEGADYNTDFIKKLIILEANETYANGASLEEDKQEIMNDYFNPEGFACDADGLIFYYSYNAISGGSVKGIYECHLTYADVYSVMMTPEQYYNTYFEG